MTRVLDLRSRPLRDLRVSVTGRCNFRCTYCMPKEVFGRDYAFLPRAELLTFEEITRLARVFAEHGVSKVRLTGPCGPLLRGTHGRDRADAEDRDVLHGG
jgi:cyclic pyranopterin phosphate synthase